MPGIKIIGQPRPSGPTSGTAAPISADPRFTPAAPPPLDLTGATPRDRYRQAQDAFAATQVWGAEQAAELRRQRDELLRTGRERLQNARNQLDVARDDYRDTRELEETDAQMLRLARARLRDARRHYETEQRVWGAGRSATETAYATGMVGAKSHLTAARGVLRRAGDEYADWREASGAGAGGGGGGHGAFPFLGGFGMPSTGSALGKMLGVGAGIYLGSKVLEELFFLPQTLGGLESSALMHGKPYINLAQGAYGLGRAGGFAGSSLVDAFFPHRTGVLAPTSMEPPAWMRQLGLSPQDALSMLTGFGIAPRSAGQGAGIVRALGQTGYLPGLGGMDLSGHMASMATYGLVAPNEGAVLRQGGILSNIMTNAVAQGMNRAEVLRSIDAGVAMMAKIGAGGASIPGLSDFIFHYGNSPGGRSGETGLRALAGVEQSASQVGTDPMRTMLFARAAGGLRTRAQLAAFMNKAAPGSFDAFLSQNPGGAKAVDLYLQAQRQGNSLAAGMWLQQILQGNPAALTDILSSGAGGLPAVFQPFAAGTLTGVGPMDVLNRQYGGGMLSGAGGYGFGAAAEGSYAAGLAAQGVRPDLIPKVIAAARARGMNPLLLGATMALESSGGRDKSAGINVMQYLDRPITSEEQSLALGAGHLQRDLNLAGGNLREARRLYHYGQNSTTPLSDAEWSKFQTSLLAGQAAAGAGPLADINQTQAGAGIGAMMAAYTSFSETASILPTVNNNLSEFGKALDRLTRKVNEMSQRSGPMGNLMAPSMVIP